MQRMTTSKKKTSAKTAAGDGTTLLEASGNRRFVLSLVSHDGGSLTSKSSAAALSLHITDMDSPRGRPAQFAFPVDKPINLRVIISDRALPEPPSLRASRGGAGPSFTLVASGGGNLDTLKMQPKGRVAVEIEVISTNGSN
jgi:hypothetical protein